MATMFADKVGANVGGIKQDEEKGKNKRRMIFVIIGIIIISIVMAAWVYDKYGTVYLGPGEHYTVNIPFIGASEVPVICGKAYLTSENPVKDINITVKYYNNESVLAWNLTNKDGKYCIYLPEITKNTKYDVYVGYDNETMTLGKHDYSLTNLKTEKEIYNRSVDQYVIINGTINNEDAKIENGRMDVNLKYHNESTGKWEEIFDYKRYYVNIESNDEYPLPNDADEVNISWEIPNDAKIGKYKFYIKTSFNAEKTKTGHKPKNVYFNITE